MASHAATEEATDREKTVPHKDQDEEDRSPPIAIFFSGEAFLTTARHVHQACCVGELKLRFEMPVYYLYSHGIELVMKAFLREKGMTASELRQNHIRHSPQKLWAECLAHEIILDAAPLQHISEVISLLEPYATTFEFRYIQTGYKRLPSLRDVRSAAETLSAAIRRTLSP